MRGVLSLKKFMKNNNNNKVMFYSLQRQTRCYIDSILTLFPSLAVQRLGELFRKLWNPRNFKAHVSPHEMLQAVASISKKRFKITEQGEDVGGAMM